MNFKRCAISFAVLSAVFGALALPAGAQTFKGTFTLPYEVVWGPNVLEPGEYTVWSYALTSSPLLHIEGNGRSASVITGVEERVEPAPNKKGRIEITDVNGAHVVTKLIASAAGREYSFEVPGSVKKAGIGVATMKKSAIPMSR